MDLRGQVWKTVSNWNDLFWSEKGSERHSPNKNSTPPPLMRITTKKVSLHSMRIYLQKYQWLQTVAQSRCDGYTTGSFWAMMCIRLQNYLQYQLPIEYKFLYCYSTLSLHLFFCTFAPWVISSSQCLFSPNFCFCVLTEVLQIAVSRQWWIWLFDIIDS